MAMPNARWLSLSHRIAKGEKVSDIQDIRGTAFLRKAIPEGWDEIESTKLDRPGTIDKPIDPYEMKMGKADASCALDQVIPGWTNGIPGMKVGGHPEARVIPGDQAYGANPPSADIAPNETLVFVVDLLAVFQYGRSGARPTEFGYPRSLMISTMSSPASVGFSPTCTPAASRASILAAAVPLPPGDDGAGVAHLLAGRSGDAGDVGDDRLASSWS